VIRRRGVHGTSFAIRYRAGGRRVFQTLDATTRAEAEEQLADVLAALRLGTWQSPRPEPAVEARQEIPTFHEFSSSWVESRRHEVSARTVEHLEWALSGHLLRFFAAYPLDAITPELVDTFRIGKLREREELLARKQPPGAPKQRGLSNSSVNKLVRIGGMVMDSAVEYEHVVSNPFRGKRRRVKESKPRRTWLELAEVRAILDAAGTHRPLVATLILAGPRISELLALRWRDVDLATARLQIVDSKTDAGIRTVDVSPMLLDELKTHKIGSRYSLPDNLVFCTSVGTPHNRNNVRVRILGGAITRANKKLLKTGQLPVQDGVTNHTCRRTFASLLYEAGASPAYVMSQMRHTSSALALEVYAKKMERSRDTGARMDALIQGADWAQTGTNDVSADAALTVPKTKNTA
jgi:integrase